eukprot:TRINITY_DN16879_c0_g1_i1.p1 TRINITY_DN16879_c0_g1~~TRINITY_DN16879_c0_g1_i1.p1  ORF type:complete len:501 (+),score=112.56 TRINITY_DN16879_c0_g1_i1:89-1591(+)
MTSRTGLIPAVTRSASFGKERDGKPVVKKVSSATLARRARSPSPSQVARGGVKTTRRDDSLGRQRREVTHRGYQRNTLLGSKQQHSETVRSSAKPSVSIPTAMMGIRNHDMSRTHQPVSSAPSRDVHFNHEEEQDEKDLFDIDNISANTSEVRDLIKMYKVLLGGGETDTKGNRSEESDVDIQPAALTPEAIGSMSLKHLEEEQLEAGLTNVDDNVAADPSALELPQTIEGLLNAEDEIDTVHRKQSTPPQRKKQQTQQPKLYTDYHRQMERVEKELKESAAERAILTAQNASLESKCLGLESELEAMRKQHVELHLSTQTTNEKLITSIQGILTSMNDLSERVRAVEANQQAVQPSAASLPPVSHPVEPVPRSEVAEIIRNYGGSAKPFESATSASTTSTVPLSKKITIVNEPASLNIDTFDHRSTARCLNLGADVQPISLTPAANINKLEGNSQSPGASPDESVGSGSTSPSPYSMRTEIRRLQETYGSAVNVMGEAH